jgi:hypothetical protein
MKKKLLRLVDRWMEIYVKEIGREMVKKTTDHHHGRTTSVMSGSTIHKFINSATHVPK